MKRAILLSSVLAFCGLLLLGSWLMLHEAAQPPSVRLASASARRPPQARRRAPLPDEITRQVRLDQKLNAQVPLDLKFRDETGKLVPLHEYFGRKPVMMNLIQYRCTMLCSEEMNVLGQSLKELKFSAGDQFNLLTVSIDARETPALAMAYKQGYLDQYRRPTAAAGWHFLTGDEATIRRLADAIGYHFVYDARTDQFAHPDGVIVLTPEGRVARYFFRLQYPPRDLRLALVEAAEHKIGTLLDAWALICYHYNPATGQYSLALMNVLRLAAVATLLFVGMGVATMTMWDRRRKSALGARLLALGTEEPGLPSAERQEPRAGA
jgi:protein SCO1/2